MDTKLSRDYETLSDLVRAYRTGLERTFLERVPEIEAEGRFFVKRDGEAVRHLLEVASGLQSMVLGEPEILGQVKQATGLAETLGDPWRQLSSKKRSAWRIERWLIHLVLVCVVLVTLLLWVNSARRGEWLGEWSSPFAKAYGFWIGAIFSGVIGVGFYPLLGSRVWCRFGCPQAAILGLVQRLFSRFRITTNGGQCMSCGNCSTYCEMGIDVRAYAQQSRNIVRASCVGCGVCAAVCPRGVLRLENGLSGERFEGAENPWATLVDSLQRMDAPGYRAWPEAAQAPKSTS